MERNSKSEVSNRNQVFFTYKVSYSGFTDLLWQFQAVYKLGNYLGYSYFHNSLQSNRSSMAPKKSLLLKPSGLMDRIQIAFYKRFGFWDRHNHDIFTFLGLNDYLSCRSVKMPKGRINHIRITLDEKLIAKGINTLNLLVDFIRNEVNGQLKSHDAVLITFNFEHHRTFIGIINTAIKGFPPDLNFREAFFQRHKKGPTNLFCDDKKRLLIHIRQGDTATIKTPWNTYFSVWDQHKNPFLEFDKIAGVADDRTFFVDDFYNFYHRTFNQRVEQDFSTAVFSDGFELAFLKIFKRHELFKFSKSQSESLKISSKVYETNAFNCFAESQDIRLVIGETPENLQALIHALLHADIIVTGTQNKMIPKFLSLYFNETEMPVLILLFKKRKPSLKSFGFSDQNSRIIYVDAHNYNPEEVLEKINSIQKLTVSG